jgi:Retinal pigment epithelial membrane protein
MPQVQPATHTTKVANFTPYSAIGTNLEDVRKRRREHDPTVLNLQICWYLKPEAAAKLDPEVLDRLSAKVQPIYGTLLTADADTLARDRERLPPDLQAQIPTTWQLPADLWGYAFFACPLPPVTTYSADQYARGDRMVLNGDGMLYRLGFEAGRAILKTRMMKTPCYYADLAAQLLPKFDKPGYRFLDGGMVRHSLLLGTRNQMNTAFLATKKHLLATFDAARPHIIDPDTLELLEPIGAASNWQGLAPKQPDWLTQVFQPYSNPAHPVCDHLQTDAGGGEFITANYSAGLSLLSAIDRFRRWLKDQLGRDGIILKNPWGAFTSLVRYRFDSQTFEKWRLVLPNGEPIIIQQAIHQMALTEDYIIVGDIAFKIELSQIFAPYLFGRIRKFSVQIGYWLSLVFLQLVQPIPYANLYLVKRSDLDLPIPPGEIPTLTAIKIVLPREVSHFVTDYRNPNGQITLMSAHNGGWDVTEWIGEYDESLNPDCERTSMMTKGIEALAGVNKKLPKVPPTKCLRREFRGFQPSPVDLNSVARYTIDGNTGAVVTANFFSDIGNNPSKCNTWSVSVNTHRNLSRDSRLPETSEKITSLYWMGWGFTWETIPKRIYRAYRDRDNRVIPVEGLPHSDMPVTLLRLDTERMAIADSFEFPIGYIARSPQFIPSSEPCPAGKDPATHGYIVCVIMTDAEPDNPHTMAQDEIWVFHADDFKGKPVYRLSHPEIDLGLTIHSTWIPTIEFGKYSQVERAAMRTATLDRDYNPVVQSKIFPHTKTLFKEVVYPHYINQTSEAQLLDLWADRSADLP